jgi:radical SAM/Cys-rich protein
VPQRLRLFAVSVPGLLLVISHGRGVNLLAMEGISISPGSEGEQFSPFLERLAGLGVRLRADTVEILQANLGYRCNLSCLHCHIQAGPQRNESMAPATLEHVLRALERHEIPRLDLTGGAPEMHPQFEELVRAAVGFGCQVSVRTNLAIMEEAEYRRLPDLYSPLGVEVIGSMPCYTEELVDQQRGRGVYARNIRVLQRLNDLGYGDPSAGLLLHLVYNPQRDTVAPEQCALEADYRNVLLEEHGIRFNSLFTITNAPIGRFAAILEREGRLNAYHRQLAEAFNPDTLPGLMCRNTVSVAWDGSLYDCDFNQAIGMTLDRRVPRHIRDFDLEALASRPIRCDDHCYACTAGGGSSCRGALVS